MIVAEIVIFGVLFTRKRVGIFAQLCTLRTGNLFAAFLSFTGRPGEFRTIDRKQIQLDVFII